ncbi:MAG: hypothetical protein HPY66_1298 [Firmicutes bacterium]|nr:hypothetical protein [Bacillota bacterium]
MARGIGMNRAVIITVVVIVFLVFFFLSSIVNFIVDYQWFSEVKYTSVFLARLINQFKIGVPIFVLLAALLYLYLKNMQRDFYRNSGFIPSSIEKKRINRIILIVSMVISFFVSIVVARGLWLDILKYLNYTAFNVTDPIFSIDVGFYMFKLPLLREILSMLIFLAVVLIAVTVVFYGAMVTLKTPEMIRARHDEESPVNRQIFFNKKILTLAIRQVATIGFVIFLILALRFFISRYNLLFSPRGVAYGASYTDIAVTLKVYIVLVGVSILSAVLMIYAAFSKKYRVAIYGPALLVVVTIVGNIAAAAVQNFIVEPNEYSKEEKFLRYNITYTQKAYGLDKIQEKDFPAAQDLTYADLQDNRSTIENIRINDYRPVIQVYNQLQGIRPYYKFNDVDIDRYNIDGVYTQVFLSARELSQENLEEGAKTWVNKYLKYTHGYGAVVSPVNKVTAQGQPELYVRDIPPATETMLKIERPEIYFGEITNDYIITNTKTAEFDYPMGDNNSEAFYEGNAGIKMGFLNKLIFALYHGSAKILLSSDVTPDSRMILNRNIVSRVAKIAPYFIYDEDPYIVIDEGRLFWIMDGYTYNTNYPYSEPIQGGINYIRNSIKVVIDAYNGDTTFYLIDEEDAIARTFKKIFPDLFTSFEEMPQGLKEHIRYPQTLFDIQAQMYRDYHMNNTQVFYNKEDAWSIAQEQYSSEVLEMESNYVVFKLPEEDDVEFLLTVPYTPIRKMNMIAFLVARNDGDKYGELMVYKLPKNKLVYGPMQIESRISQDPTISRELSLWDQRGSEVVRGNLLVVPIEDSLLYVEPLYLRASNENSLPEMRRVIVAYKDTIVMEQTLDDALKVIFGGAPPAQPEIPEQPGEVETATIEELIRTANELFQNAQEALRNGNWAQYGEYIGKLESVLNRMAEASRNREQ